MDDADPRRRQWESFLELWQRFLAESDRSGTVIVVEGERDRRSLRTLGVRSRIALLHDGRSLARVAQSLAHPGGRVVVLTDWDLEGGHLARKLREFLEAEQLDFDLDFRRRLSLALRGEVAHVEGLAGWARRSAERAGAPLEHFLGLMTEAGPETGAPRTAR
jgi:5S rRNA maturation endonuclease (ribonuclease M5)